MDGIETLQDVGRRPPLIRTTMMIGQSGVATLVPDNDSKFLDANNQFRKVLDEHYGERLDELAEDDEQLVIERVVVQADRVPYIEYTVVEELEDE